LLDKLGSNIANDIDLSLINDPHVREKIRETVAVTTIESLAICKDTLEQAESPIWYKERSKRITASLLEEFVTEDIVVIQKALLMPLSIKINGYIKICPHP